MYPFLPLFFFMRGSSFFFILHDSVSSFFHFAPPLRIFFPPDKFFHSEAFFSGIGFSMPYRKTVRNPPAPLCSTSLFLWMWFLCQFLEHTVRYFFLMVCRIAALEKSQPTTMATIFFFAEFFPRLPQAGLSPCRSTAPSLYALFSYVFTILPNLVILLKTGLLKTTTPIK